MEDKLIKIQELEEKFFIEIKDLKKKYEIDLEKRKENKSKKIIELKKELLEKFNSNENKKVLKEKVKEVFLKTLQSFESQASSVKSLEIKNLSKEIFDDFMKEIK